MSFYDEASWVLIPEGIKEDVVYAQKPTDGLGDLTFTRASDATRTNSAGVIERTPWNLVQFSEMFSDAYWAKEKAGVALIPVVTANVELAPNGTMTADRIVFDLNGGTTSSDLSQLASGAFTYTSETRTQSIYLRTTDGTTKVFSFVSPSGGVSQITVTSTYQRFTFTTTGAGGSTIRLRLRGAGEGTATSATVAAWGAQFVEGTDAKPYFATTNRQDVPRLHYRNADGTVSTCPRLLLEPQRTNSIRNSTMVGAVAGSPGTLPTNWSNQLTGGITQTIVGSGVESGLPYVDIRFSGTATNTTPTDIRFETATQIAASNTQTWTEAIYLKVISAPNPPVDYRLYMFERSSGGGFIKFVSQVATPTTTLQRFSFTRALDGGATVVAVQPAFTFSHISGATYDFTVRIAAPQMELGATASTFIPTTTAAVTRVGEDANRTGASAIIGQTEGTVFYDVIYSGSSTSTSIMSVRGLTKSLNVSLSSNLIRLVVNGVSDALLASPNTSLGVKMAIAYNNTGVVLFANGVQINLPNTGAEIVNDLDVLQFRSITQLNSLLINQAALFTRRLTNAELAQITT